MKDEIALQLVEHVRRTYDEIAEHFNTTRTRLWGDFVHFRQFIHDGQSILDLGCGNGRNAELFAGYGLRYQGVDISSELINQAKRKEFPWTISATFETASMLELPYPDESFDLILCVATLQHIPKPLQDKAIKEMRRVLKPDGYLLMTNWNMWQGKYLRVRMKGMIRRVLKPEGMELGIKNKELSLNDVAIPYQANNFGESYDRYMYAFTLRRLKKILKDNDFTVMQNFYSRSGEETFPLYAHNLITIAQKR